MPSPTTGGWRTQSLFDGGGGRGRQSGNDRSAPPPRRPARPRPRRPGHAAARRSRRRSAPAAQARERLPAAVTTRHALALPEGTLEVEATAGAVVLEGAGGAPEAEIAYVAYTLPGADPATRPVTFAVNGGPGAASAYLNIGAIGPWRLPMDPGGPVPSQDVTLVPNAETWLPFTDLVFLDPVGTGFSRLIEPDDAQARALPRDRGRRRGAGAGRPALAGRERPGARRRATSSARATAASAGRWSPRRCARTRGWRSTGWCWSRRCSTSAGGRQAEHTPWPAVALLPSLAAAEMEAEGRFSEAALAAAEDYAAGDYVTDLLRGVSDAAAVGRIVERVTALTGLDRGGGRGDRGTGRRRGLRARGRPRRGAADERLRRGGARGRAAAGAAARRRPGARRDDRAADRGDAGALPRHARLAAGPALPAPEPRR